LKLPNHQVTKLPNSLRLLCAFLLLVQPLAVGLSAAAVLDAAMILGFAAMALLVLRLVVTAVGVGAGLALVGRRIGAVSFARVSLIASAATDLMIYITPYYPSRRAPGETPLWIAGTVILYGGWLAYLTTFERQRDAFSDRGQSS